MSGFFLLVCFHVVCVLGSAFGVFVAISSCRPSPAQRRAGQDNQATLLWHMTRFRSFWVGFEVVPAFFVLPTPPARYRAVVWVIGPLNCGTGLSFFRVFSFFVLPIPPLLGVGGDPGILVTPTVARDCVAPLFSLFRWCNITSPRPPR